MDGKNTYWAGYTFYDTGQMTVYYLPGGRSELYARRHVENGRSNESDSLYPKYSLASEEKKEEKDPGEDEGNHSGSGGSPENGNDQTPEQEKITIGKTSLKTLKNQAGRKAKVTYKKVSGAAGYEILYSTNKKFTRKSTGKVMTKKTSYTIKKLKKGKTYYFKVRAYKLDKQNNKAYGPYSKVKKLKIKK